VSHRKRYLAYVIRPAAAVGFRSAAVWVATSGHPRRSPTCIHPSKHAAVQCNSICRLCVHLQPGLKKEVAWEPGSQLRLARFVRSNPAWEAVSSTMEKPVYGLHGTPSSTSTTQQRRHCEVRGI
jgi:hypothetical protein